MLSACLSMVSKDGNSPAGFLSANKLNYLELTSLWCSAVDQGALRTDLVRERDCLALEY